MSGIFGPDSCASLDFDCDNPAVTCFRDEIHFTSIAIAVVVRPSAGLRPPQLFADLAYDKPFQKLPAR